MVLKSLDELARRVTESLPGNPAALRADVEKNVRAILERGLAQMDLVTREEFEVQQAVLLRSREKLEALEKQVAELEVALGKGGKPG